MLTEYRIYVKDFLQQFDFPQDAEEPLLSAFDLLTADCLPPTPPTAMWISAC